jgi:nucleosome binding factor SPN SPT16 subunit
MEATKISAETFKKRFERLLSLWDQKHPCDVVSILYGKEDPKAISLKTSALHLYFLGYEFVDSQIFLSKKNIVILASQKKIALLSHLKEFLAPEYNLHFLQK